MQCGLHRLDGEWIKSICALQNIPVISWIYCHRFVICCMLRQSLSAFERGLEIAVKVEFRVGRLSEITKLIKKKGKDHFFVCLFIVSVIKKFTASKLIRFHWQITFLPRHLNTWQTSSKLRNHHTLWNSITLVFALRKFITSKFPLWQIAWH